MVVNPAVVLGYHGTDRKIAEGILSGGLVLKPGEKKYDWLGRGIYFFENAYHRAYEWAKERHSDPAVIGAVISLHNALDLNNIEYNKRLKTAHDLFSDEIKSHPQNTRKGARYLDFSVIETFHQIMAEEGTSFNLVRCAFEEGEKIYEGSAIRDKTHIQICVRKESAIIGYFRPTPTDEK